MLAVLSETRGTVSVDGRFPVRGLALTKDPKSVERGRHETGHTLWCHEYCIGVGGRGGEGREGHKAVGGCHFICHSSVSMAIVPLRGSGWYRDISLAFRSKGNMFHLLSFAALGMRGRSCPPRGVFSCYSPKRGIATTMCRRSTLLPRVTWSRRGMHQKYSAGSERFIMTMDPPKIALLLSF